MQLLTWNVQWCCGLDGIASPARIVQHALALAPQLDVLCLQEVAVGHSELTGAPGDQVAQLRALLPGWQLHFGPSTEGGDAQGQRRAFGNVVATRLPVLEVAQHRLPWPAEAGVVSMPRSCLSVTVRDAALGPVRVMTTHLEYHSAMQRLAQVQALRALHAEALAHVAAPAAAGPTGSPYATPVHTPHAVLCGDFNFAPGAPEYMALCAEGSGRWHDTWPGLHPQQPQPATFGLVDRTWCPAPVACDLVLVSESLRPHVCSWHTDSTTPLSDHQPVWVAIRP